MIDIFRVGVHLGMTSNAPQMLGVIAGHFAHLHTSAGHLQAQFGKLALAAGGAVTAMAGIGVVKGIWHTIEASKELNAELNRTAQLGGKLAIDPATLRRQAFAAANEVRTLNPAEAVKLERELAGQVGSHEKAFALLPSAARLAWNLEEFTGAKSENAIKDTVKTLDLWGHIFSHKGPNGEEEVDVDLMKKGFDYMAQGVKAGGGMLKPSDYLAFMKHSGLAGKVMNPEELFGWMTEAMIAMGPARAGTASSSLFQQFTAGTAPAHNWREFAAKSGGLIKEGRDFVVGKGGHTSITDAGRKALHLDKNATVSAQWVNDTLIPILERGGVKEKDMLVELTKVLGKQTTQRITGEVYQNRTQFARTAQLFTHAEKPDDSARRLHNEDFETNVKEVEEAWKGLMQALGEPGIPLAIRVMHRLTDAIHYMTDYASAHPDDVERWMKYAAALGGLLALSGTMTVATIALSPFTRSLGLLFRVLTSVPAAASALTTLGGGLLSLLGIIMRVAGPIGAFLTVMRPSETNAGEREALEAFRAKSPEEQAKALDPTGWKPAQVKPGLLDGILDRLGIRTPGGNEVVPETGRAPLPAPNQLAAPLGPDGKPISTMPPPPAPTVNQTISLEVDGRKMAEVVNKINLGAATRANAGGVGFNPRISIPSPVGGF